MNQKINSSILFLLLILLVTTTCKQKDKQGNCVYDEAHLFVTVLDSAGQKINGATINIFNSFEEYDNARQNKNISSSAAATGISNSSTATEIAVEPYKEHWILVSKDDLVLLKYFSSELTTSKVEKLQSCSDYHVSVQLNPVGASIAFWSASSINLPIAIKFNNTIDTLTGLTSTTPTSPSSPGSPNQLNFQVNAAGTYQYQATAAGGCSWQGEVTLTDGQFKAVQLESCQRTVVAFYADASSGIPTAPNNKFPISIYIDNNPNPVGVLSGLYSGPALTTSCLGVPIATNILYVYLEPGATHSYKAVSSVGTTNACIWTGNTSVLNSNCALNPAIKLAGGGCN